MLTEKLKELLRAYLEMCCPQIESNKIVVYDAELYGSETIVFKDSKEAELALIELYELADMDLDPEKTEWYK